MVQGFWWAPPLPYAAPCRRSRWGGRPVRPELHPFHGIRCHDECPPPAAQAPRCGHRATPPHPPQCGPGTAGGDRRQFGLPGGDHVPRMGLAGDLPELALSVDVSRPPRARIPLRGAVCRLRHAPHAQHEEPEESPGGEGRLRPLHCGAGGARLGGNAARIAGDQCPGAHAGPHAGHLLGPRRRAFGGGMALLAPSPRGAEDQVADGAGLHGRGRRGDRRDGVPPRPGPAALARQGGGGGEAVFRAVAGPHGHRQLHPRRHVDDG